MTDLISNELKRVVGLTRELLESYARWGASVRSGGVHQMMYTDILEFVNFRMETIDSCLSLIERNRVPDALGLSRSLLEHYLLLMLICRGRKYFQLQNLESLTPEQFNEYFEQQKSDLAEQQIRGETRCLLVAKYPRAKRHLMYVFEGLKDSSEDDFFVPLHYFEFQEFHPETMRLKDEDYFTYRNPGAELLKARRDHRRNATHSYRHFLSYDALLQCLELNAIANAAVLNRVEAHYTFLGRFLHPTHNAARDLHSISGGVIGQTGLGIGQNYRESAALLAAVYSAYLAAGLVDEVAEMIENAPPRFISDPATSEVRHWSSRVPATCGYFWFLFNEPPLWDKFNYAMYQVPDEDLSRYGDYTGIPGSRVPFNQYIFENFQHALVTHENVRCGVYRPPIAAG